MYSNFLTAALADSQITLWRDLGSKEEMETYDQVMSWTSKKVIC